MAWGGHRSQLIISGYSLSLSLARANISHPSDGTHDPEAQGWCSAKTVRSMRLE